MSKIKMLKVFTPRVRKHKDGNIRENIPNPDVNKFFQTHRVLNWKIAKETMTPTRIVIEYDDTEYTKPGEGNIPDSTD